MTNKTSNVLAGKPLTTGGVLIAPLGTALPTDASTSPVTGFVSAGYIGDTGLVEAGARSTTKIKAWGGDIIKVLQTDFSLSYQFDFVEALNSDVLKAVYAADNVTTTAPTVSTGTLQAIKLTSEVLPHQAFVFEVKDGLARVRICVPNGQITSVGNVTYSDSAIVNYAVTVEAFYDATTGAQAIKYSDDGVFSA